MPQTEIEISRKVVNKIKGEFGNSRSDVLSEAIVYAIAHLSFQSIPPAGCFRVTNLYVSQAGKLVIEYDDNV